MDKPISAEAREWAIEQIKAHGEYSSLDDLLQQAEKLARIATIAKKHLMDKTVSDLDKAHQQAQKYVKGQECGTTSTN
jgi:hypothetical protein